MVSFPTLQGAALQSPKFGAVFVHKSSEGLLGVSLYQGANQNRWAPGDVVIELERNKGHLLFKSPELAVIEGEMDAAKNQPISKAQADGWLNRARTILATGLTKSEEPILPEFSPEQFDQIKRDPEQLSAFLDRLEGFLSQARVMLKITAIPEVKTMGQLLQQGSIQGMVKQDATEKRWGVHFWEETNPQVSQGKPYTRTYFDTLA